MDLVNLMKSMSVNDTEEPVESNCRIFAANISGELTEFVYGEFTNKLIIVAAQYGKIASLLKITVDQAEEGLNITEPVYNIHVVFGTDNIEQQAAARYLAQSLGIRKPLLLFLSLKNYETENVKGVVEALLSWLNADKQA